MPCNGRGTCGDLGSGCGTSGHGIPASFAFAAANAFSAVSRSCSGLRSS